MSKKKLSESNDIKIITAKKTNCFLVKTDKGFILIDTGYTSERDTIDKELEKAGCTEENFNLILLTHGDFDHSGNCAYFAKKYKTKIAMHEADSGMVEYGKFFWSRTGTNLIIRGLFKTISFLLRLNLKKEDRFKPDFYLQEGDNFSDYGFNATVIHLPGHSGGSIGILVSNGKLFCGDLLSNIKEPSRFSLIDNHESYDKSIKRLEEVQITMIYPGHGNPFLYKMFLEKERRIKDN